MAETHPTPVAAVDQSDSGDDDMMVPPTDAKVYPLAGRAESFGTEDREDVNLDAEPSDDDDLVGGGFMPVGGDAEEEEEEDDDDSVAADAAPVEPVRYAPGAAATRSPARATGGRTTSVPMARPEAVPRVGDMVGRVSPAATKTAPTVHTQSVTAMTTAARRRGEIPQQPQQPPGRPGPAGAPPTASWRDAPRGATPPPTVGADTGAYRSFKPAAMRNAAGGSSTTDPPPSSASLLLSTAQNYSSSFGREATGGETTGGASAGGHTTSVTVPVRGEGVTLVHRPGGPAVPQGQLDGERRYQAMSLASAAAGDASGVGGATAAANAIRYARPRVQQSTMFSKSQGIRAQRMEALPGDVAATPSAQSQASQGLSSSPSHQSQVSQVQGATPTSTSHDDGRPVLRFPAKKSIVPVEVGEEGADAQQAAPLPPPPAQEEAAAPAPGHGRQVRTPAIRRAVPGAPAQGNHRRRAGDDEHNGVPAGARGPGATARLRRASAELETSPTNWGRGGAAGEAQRSGSPAARQRSPGGAAGEVPPETVAQLTQNDAPQDEEADAAAGKKDDAAAAANATSPPAAGPAGTGVPQRISARYRDMLQMKRRGKRKNGERIRMYVNATSMKPVVLAAATALRFDFAPLRDSAQLIWVDRGISVETAKSLVEEKQRLNKYPGMKEMCNKVLFTHHLNRMSALFPEDFSFYPQTYCVPGDEDELRHLLNTTPQKRSKKRIDLKRNIWICKPSKGRQGAGIFLTQDLNDVLCERKNPDVGYVIQKYVHNPLLIDGLKFDLRLYVLVTCVDPLKVYIFDEGLARFATNKWQPLDQHAMYDAYMHLTNYSLNKDNENFVPNTDADAQDVGSKRSIKSIRDWFDKNGHDSEAVWGSINALVVNTMLALQASLQLNMEAISKPADDPLKCFQILGFDVMFDDELKPWLLEINAGPSLEADSPLDLAVKEPLVLQSMRLGTYGLLPRHKPSQRKNFEAAHCSRFKMIYPSKTSHHHEHLVLFNKELRDCFDVACGVKKGEMTASRFCKFFRECGVIRSFKTSYTHNGGREKAPIILTDEAIEQPKSGYVTNKAFELRKKMLEKREEPSAYQENEEFTVPEGYEPRYGLAKFNLDIPPHLTEKIRTLTQPELELLFLRKAKSEGTTGLSFFEFINIVVEMAQLAYGAKEFDHYTLLQKLRLFIPSRKDPNVRAEPIGTKASTITSPNATAKTKATTRAASPQARKQVLGSP